MKQQNQKIPLKIFTEEYLRILKISTADELRAILVGMANEVAPQLRADFIKTLTPIRPIEQPSVHLQTTLLDEIESLKEDIFEQGQEKPDWGYDDEDSLAEYEKFLEPL